MTRVAVTGGRDYADAAWVDTVLDAARQRLGLTILVHGGAPGLDTLADRWAKRRKVPAEVYPAQWRRWGRSAGPRRNQQMVDTAPDVLIAFRGGRGTDNMKSVARYAGVRVIEVR